MRNPVNRATLFMTELILNFFIFVACTAVCVGLFVNARGLSRKSDNLTRAVFLAQSAAEQWRAGDFSDGEWWSSFYLQGPDCVGKFYRADWTALRPEDGPLDYAESAYFLLVYMVEAEPGLRTAVVNISGGQGIEAVEYEFRVTTLREPAFSLSIPGPGGGPPP